MTTDKIFEDLTTNFGAPEPTTDFGVNVVETDRKNFKNMILHLKNHYDFGYLTDIAASHWPESDTPFHVAYNLYSISNKLRIIVNVRLTSEATDSVYDIYKVAHPLECEQWDLVGVTFEGNPDLRRVMMPDFYEGHPLRKEFWHRDRSWFNDADELNTGISFERLGEKEDPKPAAAKPAAAKPAAATAKPTEAEKDAKATNTDSDANSSGDTKNSEKGDGENA